MSFRRGYMNKLLKTALIAGGVLTAVKGLDTRLETTYYTVESPNLPEEFDGFKIVHLSDYHNDSVPNLIEEVQGQKPDIIVCTGDMADDKGTYAPALNLVERLLNIAPVFMVTGNHDLWRHDFEKMHDEMTSAGARFLRNERVFITKGESRISLLGIDDPFACEEKKIKKYLRTEAEKLSEYDGYEILLFHRANLLDEFSDYSFDLILSGHMHGGHVRIPGIGGVAAPRSSLNGGERLLFPRYFGGRFKNGNTEMIVNRGLGNPTPIPRLFNRPELVSITLRKI